MSQQNALNKFFREFDEPERRWTGSAYCQAHQQLRPALFIQLNAVTAAEFADLSRANRTWQSWHDHRLLGAVCAGWRGARQNFAPPLGTHRCQRALGERPTENKRAS